MSIDWSKAPEGATHRCNLSWYKNNGGTWFYWSDTSLMWHATPYASPENFSWWGPNIPRPGQWNGEGLPPVGTVCESMWNESRDEWFKAKVFGVNEHGQPIFRWEEGVKKYEYQASPLSGHRGKPYFRPIRTPEQIAAEEREEAIAEMLKPVFVKLESAGLMTSAAPGILGAAMGALYDNNYRKVTP